MWHAPWLSNKQGLIFNPEREVRRVGERQRERGGEEEEKEEIRDRRAKER